MLTFDSLAKRAEEEKAAKAKKGWGFGSWFGGGGAGAKDAPLENQPNKPVRAKLGEKSSFYFDTDLKRWVNKNANPEDQKAKTATPPPPRSGPRSASGTPPPPSSSGLAAPPMGARPPMAGLSQSLNPSASVPNLAAAAAAAAGGDNRLAPQAMIRSASNASSVGAGGPPPSRPGTSMSNASSIDDLLSAAGPRKPGAKKARKSGRYVDVMAQ